MGQFRDYSQEAIGDNTGYILQVGFKIESDITKGPAMIEIQIRYPFDADDRFIEGLFQTYSLNLHRLKLQGKIESTTRRVYTKKG